MLLLLTHPTPPHAPWNVAGGLLASVPAEAAEQCVAELQRAGFPRAAVVARVVAPLPQDSDKNVRLV